MKKILLFITAIFICGAAIAQTIRWHIGDTVYQTTTCNAGESITPPTAPEKFGYTFQEWEVLYTQIEYLEFTGTQWIDPNIIITGISKFEFDVQSSNTTRVEIIGSGGSEDNGLVSIRKGQGYPYFSFIRNQTRYTPGNVSVDTERHFFVQDVYNSNVRIDNYIEYIPNGWSGTQYKVYIGAYSRLGGVDTGYGWTGKYYGVKFYEKNILVRDFIPVFDKNGTPCMYDKVENKFYYNAGTGDFIAGPVIVGE